MVYYYYYHCYGNASDCVVSGVRGPGVSAAGAGGGAGGRARGPQPHRDQGEDPLAGPGTATAPVASTGEREDLPAGLHLLHLKVCAMRRLPCQLLADVMVELYYSLVYSHLTYALLARGRSGYNNAAKITRKLLADYIHRILTFHSICHYFALLLL